MSDKIDSPKMGRVTQVQEQQELLGESLGNLLVGVTDLEERLSRVLTPTPSHEELDTSPDPELVPQADLLRGLVRQARRGQVAITSILERLEL